MSYDINVLVNGNRCKQYIHQGRTYIEAKEGSEYTIEIKNNSWNRILTVLSVDGLNVVDGESASEDGAGYVMNPYTSQKFFGYQYSKENVATFKFGKLGAAKIDPVTGTPMIDPDTGKEIKEGYASSKEDGSEKNAGVIGIRIFDEVPKPKPVIQERVYDPNPNRWYSSYVVSSSWASCSYAMTGSILRTTGTAFNNTAVAAGQMSPHQSLFGGIAGIGATTDSTSPYNSVRTTAYNAFARDFNIEDTIADAETVKLMTCNTRHITSSFSITGDTSQMTSSFSITATPPNFDMETGWGESKVHKVIETDFERKSIVHELDIYYASRESLIAIGVDFGTEKKVSFPQPFKDTKYAKPPKGWKG